MSEVRNWTPSQAKAIEAKGKDLLVCASAGSGKTAVLIERIIRHILDTENHSNIREMLVVTFTEAAASQLKEKLNKALKSAIAKDPKNKHLRRQLSELPRASIATINSFCLDLVRNNFDALGLSSNVRIADEAENHLIMTDIMNGCIEEFYENGAEHNIEDFAHFCDTFALLSDSSLAEIFLGLYDTLYSQLDGIELLAKNAVELKEYSKVDPFENKWGHEISKRTEYFLDYFIGQFSEVTDILLYDDTIEKAYGSAINSDIDKLYEIKEAITKGYASVRGVLLSYEPVALGRYNSKNGNKEDAEKVKEIRNLFKKHINKILELYKSDIPNSSLMCAGTSLFNFDLYFFLSYFHNKVMEEKKHRGVVSFADCEALSLKLLCENGEPTYIAEEYRKRFKEVYIDEYQDVNAVQDLIFRMVSRKDSRFLVGDIKQSIYGFRGAEPSIFASYRDIFSDESGEDAVGTRIFLSNNFRSAENITEFTNQVSKATFVDGESSIGFYDGDLLVHSKTEVEEADKEPVKVALVRENEDKNSEALYVVGEIKKLIESGVEPKDITILLRSLTGANAFTKELEKASIPYYCDAKKEFFDNPEIALTLCWLNAIDNARRDIFLCGILKSPVYNFTIDELTDIRNECPADSLYNSVKAYTKKNSFEKGRYFLEDLNELRSFSRGKSVSELIWRLMYEKKLMTVVTKNKKKSLANVAKNNLLLFYDYAKNFENGEFKGLYNFLKYIEQIIAAKHSLPTAAAFAGAGNTVKIMTIHKSKGLEFPYCFICNTHKATNKRDMQKKLLFHKKLGVAAKIADQTGLVHYDTYIMNALRLAIEEEGIESEFLVLYVALTRAVNRMWITSSVKEPSDFCDKYTAATLSKFYAINNNSYIAWILSALKYMDKSRYELVFPEVEDNKAIEKIKADDEIKKPDVNVEALKEAVNFKYAYSDHLKIPSKMAVSRLYPDMLDDEISFDMTAILKPKKPFFALEAKQNKGADIGNATHAFMQFCDFNRVINNGVEDELQYLTKSAFLSPSAAELVDISALKSFFDSGLFKEIFASKRVFREKRFNINLEAKEFTKANSDEFKDEFVLVQGVIDCFFYNDNGGIILLDYKTDHIPSYLSEEQGIQMLRERHSTQLAYYKKALEKITGDKVVSTRIYSFALNKCIEL